MRKENHALLEDICLLMCAYAWFGVELGGKEDLDTPLHSCIVLAFAAFVFQLRFLGVEAMG